jgi:hypothetical protein
MNNKITATYEMINTLTGQKQSYYVCRNEKINIIETLIERANISLNNFPAYSQGVMKLVDNTIYVTDYKKRLITVLNIR